MDPKICIVTIVIGEKYKEQYQKFFYDSQLNYARLHRYDFKIIEDYISDSKEKDLVSLQKILVCECDWSLQYDYIVFIDSDILIHHNAPPLPIETLDDRIAVVNEVQPEIQPYLLSKLCNRITPTEYYKQMANIDFKTNEVINTGVLIVQPKLHTSILRTIFNKYAKQQIGHPNKFQYEQAVIGYELMKNKQCFFLSTKWNAIWENNDVYNKIWNIKSDLQDFYNHNHFIHFAGKYQLEKIHHLTILNE